ncbi:MAG TPA: MFS transporter [Novosphingobium sp.]|nr:MFS transporter [Novosphingobium sp.]
MATMAGAPARGTGLVFLIGMAVLLTYVDRGAIGIAAPLMKDELQLSATGFGLAVSAFFWVYAPLCLVTGWLCDRFCVYRLFAAGLFLWAVSTLLTGFVGGLAMLVVYRLLLGLGESIVFPGASKMIAAEVPDERRGTANSALAAGIAFGPAVGTLTGGLIMAGYGWRAIFLVFGLVTLLWLWPWSRVSRPLRSERLTSPVAEPYPLGKLVRLPALWAMGLGHFTSNYSFYFMISWLPLYLVKERGYSIIEMTELTTLGFLVQGLTALAVGWLSDRMVRGGADEGRLRKALLAGAQLVVAAAAIGVYLSDSTLSLALWLMVSGMASSMISGNLFAVAQMFAGPRATGSWVGMQNAIGNLAGIIGPIITGLIIDRLGDYGWAFAIAAGVSLFGAVWWLAGVPKVRPIEVAEA